MERLMICLKWVAPPAGAWIETRNAATTQLHNNTSRPPRARGLKPLSKALKTINGFSVAPPAGAWIETKTTALHWRTA